MIAEERRAILVQKLSTIGYVEVSELASQMGVSGITLRRDLSELEDEGICVRVRGGAIRRDQGVTLELPYELKKSQNLSEKKRIGEKAAEFVEPGDTIIVDAGSTTYELALALLSKKRIAVVTNDLYISVKLASNPDINLICTGGTARSHVFSLQGFQAEDFISGLRVDKTFLGADAIHTDRSISNVNLDEVPLKRAMVKAAKQVFLLADSTKFEKTGFAKVCSLSDIHIIITDSGISRERIEQYKTLGIEVIAV
jgi:DeoR family transcriptional regulator, aga operon transcriptional repressor